MSILTDLQQAGIILSASGDHLKVTGILTAAQREVIRQNKAELLAELSCTHDSLEVPAEFSRLYEEVVKTFGEVTLVGAATHEETPWKLPAGRWVRCSDCKNFKRDTIGDGTGIGDCLVGGRVTAGPALLWPNAERVCPDHEAITIAALGNSS